MSPHPAETSVKPRKRKDNTMKKIIEKVLNSEKFNEYCKNFVKMQGL
jgi:hypothetical protein